MPRRRVAAAQAAAVAAERRSRSSPTGSREAGLCRKCRNPQHDECPTGPILRIRQRSPRRLAVVTQMRFGSRPLERLADTRKRIQSTTWLVGAAATVVSAVFGVVFAQPDATPAAADPAQSRTPIGLPDLVPSWDAAPDPLPAAAPTIATDPHAISIPHHRATVAPPVQSPPGHSPAVQSPPVHSAPVQSAPVQSPLRKPAQLPAPRTGTVKATTGAS